MNPNIIGVGLGLGLGAQKELSVLAIGQLSCTKCPPSRWIIYAVIFCDVDRWSFMCKSGD